MAYKGGKLPNRGKQEPQSTEDQLWEKGIAIERAGSRFIISHVVERGGTELTVWRGKELVWRESPGSIRNGFETREQAIQSILSELSER